MPPKKIKTMHYSSPELKFKKIMDFIEKYTSFILCTHDPADADGLGAELAMNCILKKMGKECRIINSSPVPKNFAFIDPNNGIEFWDAHTHNLLPEKSAFLVLDTSDEYNIGVMREILNRVQGIFVLDHHEPTPQTSLTGINDTTASSTSELVVEFALALKIDIDVQCAIAAYTGLVYDTGFFSYSKTSLRSFTAAQYLVEKGVVPYQIFKELNESSSTGALLLHKQVFSTLEIHSQGRIAIQILRKNDLEKTGARFEDGESFINVPLRSKDIAVSILIKETIEGKVRCSLRSKGEVNVSKIAQIFGGGGHVRAAGFKCPESIEYTLTETLHQIITKIEEQLEKA